MTETRSNTPDVDEALSRAIIVWTGYKAHGWPHRDDERVLREFGAIGMELVVRVRDAADLFYESRACFECASLVEMADRATKEFRKKRPDVSGEAATALSWCYTFDHK